MIRKISIGADYKSAMHYIVGQSVLGEYVIDSIHFDSKRQCYNIYIKRDAEIVCWKQINNSYPCIIEFDINY